jgi:predicted alpha/beta hydrolase family esterase
MTVLLMPGIHNSGLAHWQSLWEKDDPSFVRIQVDDWDHPVCEAWVEAIERTVAATPEPVVIVAHSLGCLPVVEWASRAPVRKVHGLMLVSVPDPSGPRFPSEAKGFSLPLSKVLPCPSLVVSSEDDPYGTPVHARRCAEAWGSRFVNVGAAGHINADSRLDRWEQGLELLTALR